MLRFEKIDYIIRLRYTFYVVYLPKVFCNQQFLSVDKLSKRNDFSYIFVLNEVYCVNFYIHCLTN